MLYKRFLLIFAWQVKDRIVTIGEAIAINFDCIQEFWFGGNHTRFDRGPDTIRCSIFVLQRIRTYLSIAHI